MAEVKSLTVKIGCDSSQFQAGMKGMSGAIQSHKAELRQAGMAVTAVGAAIIGSVGLMVKSYVKAGDEVQKMALRTGFSTEALSELKYAADICGTDLSEFEKGIKKMSKTIVDASDGMTTYQRAFDRIGVNYKELITLSPEAQFDRIAQAISAVENPTVRAATAQEIFGRAGTKLLPLFAEGEQGLEALRAKAREMGIVFDQEAANKAAMLNDAMTTLKGSVSGVGITLAGVLIPTITNIVSKISEIITKIKNWAAEHPGLTSLILKVVIAVGAACAVLGPLLVMLPALAAGFAILTGPIGIIIAAIMGLVVVGTLIVANWSKIKTFLVSCWEYIKAVFVAVWNAIKSVFGGVINVIIGYYSFLYKTFITITMAIVNTVVKAWNWMKVGVSAIIKAVAEFVINNILWLMDQIAKIPLVKKFVKNLQEGLAAAKASIAESSAKIKTSTEEVAISTEESGKKIKTTYEMVSTAANEMKEKIVSIRNELTDKIKQATLSEYEYSKWSLEQQRIQREAAIAKEITDAGARNQLLLQSKQAYEAELANLEKDYRNKELEEKIAFATMIKEQEDQMALDRIAALQSFKDKKQELTDALNEMTMGQLEYTKWALDQERLAEEEAINKSTELNQAQKDELLKMLQKYYEKKKKLAEDDASGWLELVQNTTSALTSLFGNFCMDTLDAFQKWGEGGGNILSCLGEAFKSMVQNALSALKSLVVGMLASAAKEIIASKAVAIANVIKSVMASIPFPLNLALVGGAIAAVSALFKAIHLKEGGLVKKDTYAKVHKGELVTPLDKLGNLGLNLAPATVRQYNYFYGNINNAGDMEEISRRLAERTRRAVEGGRR